MKFIIFRTSQPSLEKPLIVGTCKDFSSKPICNNSCYTSEPEVVSSEVVTIPLGEFRFEGDPRNWKCNQIEVSKATPNKTWCRPYYVKTY